MKKPTQKQPGKSQPQNAETKPLFPMRINKYLAQEKFSTRRGADELIEKKQVFVNGKIAVLGQQVNEGDEVEVRYRGKPKPYVYYAYNKAVGVVTHSAGRGETEIATEIPLHLKKEGLFPIGRLDKNSSGLIILTNDGRITDRLLNPEFDHEKEYFVTTKEKLRTSFKDKMEAGVKIEGETEPTLPCSVKILGEKKFRVILTEGKKHQIRRMCVALFQEVDELTRTRIMNIELGNLRQGEYRKIEGEELQEFLRLLDLG